MSSLSRTMIFGAIAAIVALALVTGPAFAHERRNVSKYQLVVGFIVEPPVEGVKNGVDLRVTNAETSKPVGGLEKSLKVEISAAGTSKTAELRAIFNDPGHYTTDLIPTRPGQYVFRFFGMIEGTNINERFESGPGRFNDVISAHDLEFPDKLPQMREVSGVSLAAQQASRAADDAASSARAMSLFGVVLGALGVSLASASILIARRKG